MSEWSPQDWGIFFLAAAPFVAGLAAAVVSIVKALRENTRVTVENTQDRAVKTEVTNQKLDTIAATVGATPPVTVNVSPSPPETPVAPTG